MLTVYLYTLGSVLAVSLLSFVGVLTLSWNEQRLRSSVSLFISLAVGALLGDVFIHMIPEALDGAAGESVSTHAISLLIVSGILSFFVLEKFMHWHHHGEDANHTHPVGKLVLLSDGVHNFMDGIIIAASFVVSVPVGVATTVAVVLHEIPQEIGDFAVLLHAGYVKKRALLLNFLSALAAIGGALFFFLFDTVSDRLAFLLLPIAAGGFIYIAMADLIPELHKTEHRSQSWWQLIMVLVGIALMFALTWLE